MLQRVASVLMVCGLVCGVRSFENRMPTSHSGLPQSITLELLHQRQAVGKACDLSLH